MNIQSIALGLIVMGIILLAGAKIFPWIGHLPGDFQWQWGSSRFYLPLATCILASIILTLIMRLWGHR